MNYPGRQMVLIPSSRRERAVRTALNLVQEDVSLHKVCIVSDSMSTLQLIQNLHPSQYAADENSDENLNVLASLTNKGCHHNVTRCPSHSGVRGNELRGSQRSDNCRAGRENHHYDTVKRQYTRQLRNPLLPTNIYGERGEKVNHKMESLHLSRKEQVSISRLRRGHHPDLNYFFLQKCKQISPT